MISSLSERGMGRAVPYSPSRDRKRSWPNNVCMMSNVDSFSILKFKGAAIVWETKMVS